MRRSPVGLDLLSVHCNADALYRGGGVGDGAMDPMGHVAAALRDRLRPRFGYFTRRDAGYVMHRVTYDP